mmetsp:Transcript_3464/g.7576  ORF Transcript_3464/g.7576 Transcript_3464/m.7576 type:complete len:136 (+) Transcript_3464:371-778(+)
MYCDTHVVCTFVYTASSRALFFFPFFFPVTVRRDIGSQHEPVLETVPLPAAELCHMLCELWFRVVALRCAAWCSQGAALQTRKNPNKTNRTGNHWYRCHNIGSRCRDDHLSLHYSEYNPGPVGRRWKRPPDSFGG